MIEPARRLPTALATVMLAIGALGALWTAPAAAKRTGTSCPAHAHRRALHRRSCARTHRHGSRRPAGNTHRRAGSPAAAAGPLRTAPVCGDGRTAVKGREGERVCGDGSTPSCEEGRTPTDSSEGDVLYCTASPPPGGKDEGCGGEDCEPSDPGERSSGTACQEGGFPTLEENSFSCPDGGEPSCPEGTEMVLSGDETELLCEPAATNGQRRS